MKTGLIIAAIVLMAGFVFWNDISAMVKGKKSKSTEMIAHSTDEARSGIQVHERWDLPAELKEISGLAYLGNNRFACIQDEEGTIFIFNTTTNKVEEKIPFGGPGDYEGITLEGTSAWVVRADGQLFEVDMDKKKKTQSYQTALTAEHNVEGLCYDKNNNRLLLAIKDEEPGNKNYKGIYAFDLADNQFKTEPVIRIELNNEIFKSSEKKNKAVKPSSIGIQPQSNELYITDGPKSRLLILNSDGKIRELIELGREFEQPEGITFNEKGEIFISNEGTKKPGNIMKVSIK